MKRFEKRNRTVKEWRGVLESSYEIGYEEGDYLLMAGFQAALPPQLNNAPEEQKVEGPSREPAAAIPFVNG